MSAGATLDVRTAAARLGVSYRRLLGLVERGELQGVKADGTLRVPVAAVDRATGRRAPDQ